MSHKGVITRPLRREVSVSKVHPSQAALDRGSDPRVVRSRQAALSAVQELLAEHGWTGVTHVAVASRSGVGRTTLYRHWPDVASLIHDAIVQRIGQARTARTEDLRADLIRELNGLRRLLHDPASERTMRAVLERAPFDPTFASLKEDLYRSGSAGFRAILGAAMTRGELRSDTDIPLTIDQLAGPLMYRRLFAGLDIDEKYAETIVDSVLRLNAIPVNSTPRQGHRRKRS
jgi:AcrR family transcriptional regulator